MLNSLWRTQAVPLEPNTEKVERRRKEISWVSLLCGIIHWVLFDFIGICLKVMHAYMRVSAGRGREVAARCDTRTKTLLIR